MDKEIIIDSNHILPQSRLAVLTLSPQRTLESFPYQSTASLRVGKGRGPQGWGESNWRWKAARITEVGGRSTQILLSTAFLVPILSIEL